MKYRKLIIAIFFFALNVALGQEKQTVDAKGWGINNKLTSNKNNQALHILDGVLVDNDIMQKINSSNVESVTVLKKEKATDIYGEKGKNGAILIKTKNIEDKELKKIQKIYAYEYSENKNKKVKIISGKATDCENIPMADVVISNLNSKEIVKSDSIGKYNITVHKNDVLEFSLNGFESQRILVEKQKVIDVKLKVIQKPSTIMLKKPVIYLYPTVKTDITFTLDFKGKLLTTFPKYDDNWNITAYPDGKILDKKTNRFYTSLFWDGENNFDNEHYNYKDGFVVSKNNLTTFLIEKLEFMGLNTSETNEFVQYWLPILEKNETNFIHFWVNEDYNVFSKNNMNPKPDTSIRIFMEFYGLENPLKISEQILYKTKREGFTLVEWGGSDVSTAIKQFKEL